MNVDLSQIYNRLNQGTEYTPLSAEVFGDWALEAGDEVSVSKGGQTYQTPVMQSTMRWNGAAITTLESTGNKKRDALSKLSKREYNSSNGRGGGGSGGGGFYNTQKLGTRIDKTDEAIELEAWNRTNADGELDTLVRITAQGIETRITNEVDGLQANITATAETLRSEYSAADGALSSAITQTATALSLEVTNRENADTALSSSITQTATALSLEVTNRENADTALSGRIDVQADRIGLVVEGTGENARIKPASIVASINNGASTIKISADHIDIDGVVTATAVKSAIADISDLTVGGALRATNYYLGTGAVPVSLGSGVYDVRIAQSGNTYTLQKQTYSNGEWTNVDSFSRATTLTGSWSSGTYTVTASPQGTTITTGLSGLLNNGDVTVNGKKVTQNVKVMHSQGEGQAAAPTGLEVAVTIDASAVWDAAEAQFVEVTVNTRGEREFVYVPSDSGSKWYEAGSAATYFDIGSNTAVYKAGDSYSYRAVSNVDDVNTLYESGGSYTHYDVGSDTRLYKGNGTRLAYVGTISGQGSTIFYKQDSSGSYYLRGAYVDPSKKTGYNRGTGHTVFSVSGTKVGDKVTVTRRDLTPIKSDSWIQVSGSYRYKGGSEKYYQKQQEEES